MNKSIIFIAIVFLLTAFACEDNNSSSNKTEEEYIVNYDAEANIFYNTIENGINRRVARFTIYVDKKKEENVFLKHLTFKLQGIGDTEEEELAFYDALDDFYFFINGEITNPINALNESAMTVTIRPLRQISLEGPITIELRAKNVNSKLAKVNGIITVTNIEFGNTAIINYDTIEWQGNWDIELGENNPTSNNDQQYVEIQILNFNVEEECENCIYYDVEARITENTVSNGSDRLLSRFEVFVNHNHPEDIFLKGIKFRLTGSGENEEEELAFYDALDDFYFIINGEIVEAFQETATTISLQPMVSIDMENTVMIEMRVANVNATLPEVHGIITVENILLGDINKIGQDTKNWEEKWDPNLGQSNATCIIELIDGWMAANWQRAEINIVNDDIDYTNYDIETSTEIVSLQNGLNQSIATFTLFVESNRNDIHFHQVNFSLSGFNTEEEELEFYDALDNFTVIINGQEIVPAVDTATLVIPQFSVLVNGPVTIELRADVYSTYQNLRGTIRVDRVFLNHPRDDGMGIQYPENMLFKPELGNALGHTTAIYQTVNGGIPGWRFPDITIN